jgi:hypothetical protein
MAWTVEQLITKFRELTGRPSASQISDANILIEINHYYQYIFPVEAGIPEFKGWYTFNSSDGTGYQDLPETVTEISPPAYVDNDEVGFWIDEKRFYEEYPHDYTTESIPTDILLIDRRLILRPIPDDTYEVRLRKKSSVPDALTSGNLDNSLWGPAIYYGTSIAYLSDQGEDSEADTLKPEYFYHLSTINRQRIRQQPTGKRPIGGRF